MCTHIFTLKVHLDQRNFLQNAADYATLLAIILTLATLGYLGLPWATQQQIEAILLSSFYFSIKYFENIYVYKLANNI
jgi:hypothetical protein